jgi:Ubiquitin family
MNIRITTPTGEIIFLNFEATETWSNIKEKIFVEKNINVASQRIVVSGQLVNDHELVKKAFDDHNGDLRVHLVVPLNRISLETHNIYAVVHNFYEKIENASLFSFQYVIPLSGNETPANLQEAFEKIYSAREQRKKKNIGQTAQVDVLTGLLGIKKECKTQLYEADYGTQTVISINENQPLKYQFFSYMLENSTPVLTNVHLDTSLNNINQAFCLFCAQKRAQDPDFIARLNEEIQKEFGEVSSYIDIAMETVLQDKSPQEKLRFLDATKNLCQDKRPSVDDPIYKELYLLDVIDRPEVFQIVRKNTEGKSDAEKKSYLLKCKQMIKILLEDKVRQLSSSNISPTALDNSIRILAFDQGGTLEMPCVRLNAQGEMEPDPKDLILDVNKGIYNIMPDGEEVLSLLDFITFEHPNCLLAFHSKNALEQQLELLQQMKNAMDKINKKMPHFSFIPVYDKRSARSSENPEISFLDNKLVKIDQLPQGANIDDYSMVLTWGADDLNGKTSVRNALEKGVKIYQSYKPNIGDLDKQHSCIFDDGLTIPETAVSQGWQGFLVSSQGADADPSSKSLIAAVKEAQKIISVVATQATAVTTQTTATTRQTAVATTQETATTRQTTAATTQTTAPIQTTAVTTQTTAATTQTTAATTQTVATTRQTTAAPIQTTAATTQTTAPIQTTAVTTQTVATTRQTTAAPIQTTAATTQTTAAPIQATAATTQTTAATTQTVATTRQTTAAPIQTTAATTQTTAPIQTTAVTTQTVATTRQTTAAPIQTTAATTQTTAAPIQATAATTRQTTAAPIQTVAAPIQTTASTTQTTAATTQTTAATTQTTAATTQTVATTTQTTAAPIQTTAATRQTTAATRQTTAATTQTVATTTQTIAATTQTTAAPIQTVAATTQTTAAPIQTTAATTQTVATTTQTTAATTQTAPTQTADPRPATAAPTQTRPTRQRTLGQIVTANLAATAAEQRAEQRVAELISQIRISEYKYAKARKELIEVCERYLAHNLLELGGLIAEGTNVQFFQYALKKEKPTPGFADWVSCVYYEMEEHVIDLYEEDDQDKLTNFCEDLHNIFNNPNQMDPQAVHCNLQKFISALQTIVSGQMTQDLQDELNKKYLYSPSDPLSIKIYLSLSHLKDLAVYVDDKLLNSRTTTPTRRRHAKMLRERLDTSFVTFEKYLKGTAVAELRNALKEEDSTKTNKDVINSFAAQLKVAKRDILTTNLQSKTEFNLKLLSLIGILFGVGIFTTLGLVIKRLYDTGGTSINFFKPLSTNLCEDAEAITANCLNQG